MNRIISIGVLQKDIDIYRKMNVSPKYLEELKELDAVTTTLQIKTISLYYCYQMVLKQLEKYSYYEATIFKRLNDENYHNLVSTLSNTTMEKPKERILTNIIPFKKL